jgi:hypothetical protein
VYRVIKYEIALENEKKIPRKPHNIKESGKYLKEMKKSEELVISIFFEEELDDEWMQDIPSELEEEILNLRVPLGTHNCSKIIDIVSKE